MTENIKIIFEQNTLLLSDTDKAIIYFREQQYEKALHIVADSMNQINYIVEAIIIDRAYFNLVATESVMEMLSGILEAKKNKDYVLLADLLELQLVSFLCNVQELIINKEDILFEEENYKDNIKVLSERDPVFLELLKEPINPGQLLERGYRVEFTSCGLMTLALENDGLKFYLHTNCRIQSEAFLLARHWYQPDKKKYIIYGFGMGYHIRELNTFAPDVVIEVYESDLNVIKLACAFTNVKGIFEKDQIKLVYDPYFDKLQEQITSLAPEESFIIHYPSYKNVRSEIGREVMENYIPWSKTIEMC